ncbi:MAG: hypothetical protein O3B87_05225 [bacterium]|nr:hypothetical protein [bacterium]
MSEERSKILAVLAEFGEIQELEEAKYAEETDNWWYNLSQEDRERAFFSVVKRIVQGELREKTTYRGVLYNTFGFDEGAYLMGMSCGFMELHNSIYTQEEMRKLRDRELAVANIPVMKTTVELKDK